MSLVQRLTGVYDRVGTLPARFGDPRYPLVCIQNAGQTLVLTPQPKVLEVDARRVAQYLAAGVEIAIDDKVISGISRTYTKEQVSKGTYLINATRRTDGTWTGLKADVISVSENDLLTWTVVVRRYRSR